MTKPRATVYMNHGLWVAQCPVPGCMNAEKFGRCQDGTVGGLTGQAFRCRVEYGGCGITCPADWPANIADIETLVLARPFAVNRNWLPGEDLVDLLGENITHGVVPKGPFAVTSDRIEPLLIEGA